MPKLVKKLGVASSHYVCVIPTKKFQTEQYKKRPWIDNYLLSCSDKDKAFENWMERDALFALSARKQAEEEGYTILTVDGNKNIDENMLFIEKCFNL